MHKTVVEHTCTPMQIDPKSKEKVRFADKTNLDKHLKTLYNPEVRGVSTL